MSSLILLNSFISVLYLLAPSDGQRVELRIKYRYFDDYLTNLGGNEQSFISGAKAEVETNEGSGEPEEEGHSHVGSVMPRPLPIKTGSIRSKETSCCMLGQLAADKGYHCFSKFYAARVMFRNYNRAHNKKIIGLQYPYSQIRRPGSVRDSADKLMWTFSKCVTNQAQVFHKCCHLSAIQKTPSKYRNSYKSGSRKR